MITDQVFIGTAETACNGKFIGQNQVTHILNTNGSKLLNIYDPLQFFNKHIQQKLQETDQSGSKLIGNIKYYNIESWDEHKTDQLDDQNFVLDVY